MQKNIEPQQKFEIKIKITLDFMAHVENYDGGGTDKFYQGKIWRKI